MNKKIQALATATTLALAFMASSAAFAQNSYKNATWEDMHVGDSNGYLIVRQNAQRIYSCTSDDHLVTTYVFPTALRRDAAVTPMPSIDSYLTSLKSAFMRQSRSIPVSLFNVGKRYPPSLPPGIVDSLENASHNYNSKNNTNLNWMIRAFATTDAPHQACIEIQKPK